VRTPESPKSGFFTMLSLRKPSWTIRVGLQAISGQNCKSQHHLPGDHKLVRYPVQVLVLLRNGLQAASMRVPIVPPTRNEAPPGHLLFRHLYTFLGSQSGRTQPITYRLNLFGGECR
jgi:hypothetical protein